MIVLAHGLGGRSDLPIPLWMALYGGAAALLISFFALGAFWQEPRLKGNDAGRALPAGLEGFVDSPVTRLLARLVGVALLIVVFVVALIGDNSATFNPAPTWFYVWFWVGLVPLSMIFGPVWKVMNPLRAVAGALRRFINGSEPDQDTRPLPTRIGYWPATASLAAFVWLELVFDQADKPLVVAGFITIYSAVQIMGGVRYGQEWFMRGDGFEVYSSLIGRLAPVGRRSDGRLVWRSPLNGLAGLRSQVSLVPVVAVTLGSTAFDGLTRTDFWILWSERANIAGYPLYLLLGTAGLVVAIGFVWLTYAWATTFSEQFVTTFSKEPVAEKSGSAEAEGVFIHSLVPIAVGYTIAHYFSLLMFQGQAGYILASDPLQQGWNLFGTANWRINYTAVSTSLIAYVQILSIVGGHVVGVIAAHDRSVAFFPEEVKRQAQYPLLVAMVVYTVAGIALLVGT